MLATFVTRQLISDGFITGLVYGMLALGIVLVYRATRVINFAVGGMGLVGAGLLVLLTLQYGVPYWVAVPAALVVGTVYGALLELTIIRRLFDAPRVIVLVATIGIAQLSQAVLIAYPSIDASVTRFPLAIGSAAHDRGDPDHGRATLDTDSRAAGGGVPLVVPDTHHVWKDRESISREP